MDLGRNGYLSARFASPTAPSRTPSGSRATQNLLHLPALGQFIHQLVQIPNLLRQRIFNFLHTIPTNDPGDEVRIGVERSMLEECFKRCIFFDEFLELLLIEGC